MSQTIRKEQVLSVLESRFDFQSARAVLERLSAHSNLKDQDAFTPDELMAFCDALEETSSHIASTAEKIRQLGESPSSAKDTVKKDTVKKADAKKDTAKKTNTKKDAAQKDDAEKRASKKT